MQDRNILSALAETGRLLGMLAVIAVAAGSEASADMENDGFFGKIVFRM